MQDAISPEAQLRAKKNRMKSQRDMLKDKRTSLLLGRSDNEFQLMDTLYHFIKNEVDDYHKALLDYEKLEAVSNMSKQALREKYLRDQLILQAYENAINQINRRLKELCEVYEVVLPMLVSLEDKLNAEEFERERVRLVTWVANLKSVSLNFDDKMHDGIAVAEIEAHRLAAQPVIDQLKSEIEQYQADATIHLSRYTTQVVEADYVDESDSEESDDASEETNEHEARTVRWKQQVTSLREQKQQQMIANKQEVQTSSNSTLLDAPEPDAMVVAMTKRITALKPRYRQLICDILEGSKGVKYNKVCSLLPKLGGKLKESGGGSSHKTIEFSLYTVDIYSVCKDTRKQVAALHLEHKAKGGIFRQHRHGDYTPELCPFNLRLLSDLFEKVGITKELMLSVEDKVVRCMK